MARKSADSNREASDPKTTATEAGGAAPTPSPRGARAKPKTGSGSGAKKAKSTSGSGAKAKGTSSAKRGATSTSKAKAKSGSRSRAGAKGSSDGLDLNFPDEPRERASTGRALVIVESPKKATAIGKFLGSKYVVRASKGHVRDLVKKKLGLDVERGFAPTYEVIPDQRETIAGLRKEAEKADLVYLATDPDREGEAIAWHLQQALRLRDERVQRVRFHEITERAVREAFRHGGPIDMRKVDAQQARRILDRLTGYHLSPLLWKKVGPNLSAGRVQSVAVRLIVEREKEIRAFVAEEYWEIEARLAKVGATGEGEEFSAKLAEFRGAKFRPNNEADAMAARDALAGAPFSVKSREEVDKRDRPEAPFKTTTLQQQASIRLRFSSDRTMRIAQQLYEGIDVGGGTVGLITYMRTDSLRVSDEAISNVRRLIEDRYGERYLPKSANQYEAGKLAQEAHEAIRPTDLSLTPESLQSRLTPEQHRLYDLIYRRFVASQMTPAVFAVTNVEIDAGNGLGLFKTQGRILKFDGYRRVLAPAGRQEDALLPDVAAGDALEARELIPTQHFTQPPPRYNEASLIKALEKENIGRPSTYAEIIKRIQSRHYVEQKERRFYATNLGMVVTDLLVEHFPKVLDLKFTSRIEDDLDRIMSDQIGMVEVLDEFYAPFSEALKLAETNMRRVQVPSDKTCPNCGAPMVEKFNRSGRFLGCSRYPDCATTMSIDGKVKAAAVETEHACGKCGKPLLLREGKRGPFLSCSGYPECDQTYNLDESGNPVPSKVETEHVCEKCGKPMLMRQGRRGPFLGCSGYPKCRNTKQLDDSGKPVETIEIGVKCSKCGGDMAVKSSRRGPFLGCVNYPKCRGTAQIPEELRAARPELFSASSGGAAGGADPVREALKALDLKVECEKCGKPMVARQGKRGYFLGCTGYPKCRGVREPDPETAARIEAAVAAARGGANGSESSADSGSDSEADAVAGGRSA